MRGKVFVVWQFHFHSGITPAYAGKSKMMCEERCNHGITPAYAGKSVFDRVQIENHWDHPRVCGEKPLTLVN